jgi:hypothetical protein
MKEVIREGVFETNSSSVHTMTITEKTQKTYSKFVKENILYPDEFYKTYVQWGMFDDIVGGKLWEAITFEEKACLLFLYLNHGRLEVINTETKHTKFNGTLVFAAINMAKKLLPYEDVCLGVESISPIVDRGDVAIDITGICNYPEENTPDYEKAIQDFINVIYNIDLVIKVVTGTN